MIPDGQISHHMWAAASEDTVCIQRYLNFKPTKPLPQLKRLSKSMTP